MLITKITLDIMQQLMLDEVPMAPSNISEAVYTKVLDETGDEFMADTVANAAFEFASTLVTDDCIYL